MCRCRFSCCDQLLDRSEVVPVRVDDVNRASHVRYVADVDFVRVLDLKEIIFVNLSTQCIIIWLILTLYIDKSQ